MIQVSVCDAKTHLSRLLRRAASGEEIVITKTGRPVARLVPVVEPRRVLGQDAGLFEVLGDFDAPLPKDVLDGFEEGGDSVGVTSGQRSFLGRRGEIEVGAGSVVNDVRAARALRGSEDTPAKPAKIVIRAGGVLSSEGPLPAGDPIAEILHELRAERAANIERFGTDIDADTVA